VFVEVNVFVYVDVKDGVLVLVFVMVKVRVNVGFDCCVLVCVGDKTLKETLLELPKPICATLTITPTGTGVGVVVLVGRGVFVGEPATPTLNDTQYWLSIFVQHDGFRYILQSLTATIA